MSGVVVPGFVYLFPSLIFFSLVILALFAMLVYISVLHG